jgi:hypothetical protein
MWFGGQSSRFVKALGNWVKTGGKLELDLPSDFHVSTAAEANAVCDALTSGDILADQVAPPLRSLAGFIQGASAKPALQVFRERGLPILRTVLGKLLDKVSERDERSSLDSTMLFVVKVIALFGDQTDEDLIVRAARTRCLRDEYLWEIVFEVLQERHPSARRICDALRNPLPEGFLGVAYLDFANALAREGKLEDHPFATPAGEARLIEYTSDLDPENFSYTVSAMNAAPYVGSEVREKLLAAGEAHSDAVIRIEAAYAREKTGDGRGRRVLAALCTDPRFALRAIRNLEELGLAGEVPGMARSPEFQAQAEMCEWLSHPNEFGEPPDRIAVLDTRTLFWPPTNDRRQLWLLKYEYDASSKREEADIAVGLVGSMTFAMFGETTTDMSAEDLYGLHCCLELETNGDSRAPKQRSAAFGRMMLAKHNRGF